MSTQAPKGPPVWRQPDGKPVSCLEKIKVMNQNVQEIETLCADALEDGVLMGCDVDQIKAALHALIDGLINGSARTTGGLGAALRAGKHVFVEKPLSLDVATCEAVEAVARDYPDQVAMVGFVRRFDPSYAEAKAAIDQGDLGKPFLVRSQTCDQNDESGFFVRFAESSGGIFMDCSVHDIDLARAHGHQLGHAGQLGPAGSAFGSPCRANAPSLACIAALSLA